MKRVKLASLIILALVMLLSVALLACSGKTVTETKTNTSTVTVTSQPSTTSTTQPTETTTALEGNYGGTFKLMVPTSPVGNFGNPMTVNYMHGWIMCNVWAEHLIDYQADGSVKPLLAESWKFSDDYMYLDLFLRKGVKFHDGTDFTADAVKFILDMNIELDKAAAVNWESIEIIDDYTVRINFTKFQNTIWGDLDGNTCVIVSPKGFRENGAEWAAEHPVGTGPFKYVSYTQDVSAVFEKNENYWQKGLPYLERLEIIPIKDYNTMEMAITSGEGQALAMQGGITLNKMEQRGFKIIAPFLGTFFLAPDTVSADSPFLDQGVREAIEYAIDKKAICNALGYGYMVVDSQLIPNSHPYYNTAIPDDARPFSQDKAKQLLAAAGQPNIKTSLVTQPFYKNETEMYQQFLAEVGIDAEIEMLENAAWYGVNYAGWPGKIFVGAASYGPNWVHMYRGQFFPPYYMGIDWPDNIEQMVDDAISEPDPATQKQLNQAISNKIYEDALILTMFSSALGYVVSPDTEGGNWHEGAGSSYWNPVNIWFNK